MEGVRLNVFRDATRARSPRSSKTRARVVSVPFSCGRAKRDTLVKAASVPNTGALTLGRTDTTFRCRNNDDVKVIHHLQHANRLIRLDLCGSRDRTLTRRTSSSTRSCVQVQGGSPLQYNYVNPADDPSKK